MTKSKQLLLAYLILIIIFSIIAIIFFYSKKLVGYNDYPKFGLIATKDDNPKFDENPFNDSNFRVPDQSKLQKLTSSSNYLKEFPSIKIPNLTSYQTKLLEDTKDGKKIATISLKNSTGTNVSVFVGPIAMVLREGRACSTDFKQISENMVRILRRDKNNKPFWLYGKIPVDFSVIDTAKFETDFEEYNSKSTEKNNKDDIKICTFGFEPITLTVDTANSGNEIYVADIKAYINQVDLLEIDDFVMAIKV